ncbi:unnamed protein product [Euphydryas editha]|uniref:Ciliogenesis-associated TTC17-interacting protein N-terminal domain-containing protein n=1 Tax=Euphydryas editha TaxID=104508 RepID=A0AAU9VAV6_EUPED|nr:unnamed protein product [Euphydryas editha]
MSIQSHISLIDLTKQFKFQIDEVIKKQLCFNETLVVSCTHYEGSFTDHSDSETSCTDSLKSKESEKKEDNKIINERPKLDEPEQKNPDEEEIDENDFHYYFFPDCKVPSPSKDSKASLILVDGFPKINSATKNQQSCTCEIDKTGKCPCHLKAPCLCGRKKQDECICSQAENICLCEEGSPRLVCKCKPSKVCLCHPDGKPRPRCTCAKIDKPCICQPNKFPYPVCVCECKPDNIGNVKRKDQKNNSYENQSEEAGTTGEESESEKHTAEEVETPKKPCICQKPDPKPICLCIKGKKCICQQDKCICDVQHTCICDPKDAGITCNESESKTICSCFIEPECKCDANSPDECDCFPKPTFCNCGDPENCTCYTICECKEPCLCDTIPVKQDICTCDENNKDIASGYICTCPPKKEEVKILKRKRAGKDGYRWCHDVDPKHNFFGFSYGRHDKISYKEQEKEKLKILGLYDESKQTDSVCAIHGIKAPVYKKKVHKPSIDCCSAVGGISISVETLGEDKDKFLVQVVSHASKEGAKIGSKLVSILDCNLHILEENRTEHITRKNVTKERRSYMTICESGYYNKVTRICGERHFVKRLYHSFEAARNFLLEGANVVLLRYFGISRFCGHVKTDTVLINGTICESVYVCLGVSQAIVNGKPLFVVKVERHIIEPSGFIHQTLTVLTLKGYMVSHEWADSSYIFHINPLLKVVPEKDEIESHEPLREKWRSDLQLLSDYLDFKSTRTSEGARYMTENGELTGIIRDYLQTLLLLRPNDALHFTRHYFGSAISSLDLPHDEYFDSCNKRVRYYFFEE